MTARSRTAARSGNSSDTGSTKGLTGSPTFYPPVQKPLMVRLVQSVSYWLARILYKFRISVSESDVGRVRAIENARLVFVCNHPTMEDGITLFVLSARLGQLFHYIVAYESFGGLMGWFIQRLGCYSIRRGLGDRASISQTLSLLKEPQCRLVIFPEGGCSYQNDTIMPFRAGAIQLPMSVLAQLAKTAAEPAQVPDFYLVPLSLKYRYQQPMRRVIESTLARLESKLGIAVPSNVDDYQRLRKVAHQVILKIEAEANVPNQADTVKPDNIKPVDVPNVDDSDWNRRIERLKQIFIQKCETALNIAPTANLPLRERVYKVQAVLDDAALALEATRNGQLDEDGRLDEKVREALYWDTVRLLNFDAIYDGYVAESPTAERFLDTLTRLEREVFHLEHAQPKAPRKACFHIGEPINLKNYLADYQRDRSGTIDQLSEYLRQTMQHNLNQMAQANSPGR